jgi:hypothetical protein
MPMPINDGREPGPEVSAVTDERGNYTLTVFIWTLEALRNSSSFQLMLDITPPPGLRVTGVSNSIGIPVGSGPAGPFIIGNPGDPIDVTLGPA